MLTHLSMNLWGKSRVFIKQRPAREPTSAHNQSFLTHPEDEIEDEHQILDAHLSSGQRRHRSSLSSHTHTTEWKSKAPSVSRCLTGGSRVRLCVTLRACEWVCSARTKNPRQTHTHCLTPPAKDQLCNRLLGEAKSIVPKVEHFLHQPGCYFWRINENRAYNLFCYSC